MLHRRIAFGIAFVGIAVFASPLPAQGQLESWQSCCGAVCLRFVAGLFGQQAGLSDIRDLLRTNRHGEASLADIADAAERMGFHAVGLRVAGGKLEQCSVPVIAHQPPNHFVVILGLGKNKGVLRIDPPFSPKKMLPEEVAVRGLWHVVAVSRWALAIDGEPIHATVPGEKTPPTDSARTYGALRFEKPLWHFSSLPPKKKIKHEFRFVNVGHKPIVLSRVWGTCSCLHVATSSQTVRPGEKGAVHVTLDTTGLSGIVQEGVLGAATDKGGDKAHFFRLDVYGEVSRRGELVLDPSHIQCPELVKGTTCRKIVRITRIGGEALNLARVRSSGPGISVRALPGGDRGATEARAEIKLGPTQHLGPFGHTVIIETRHARHPTARLRISGKVVPDVDVDPSELFLGVVAPDKPVVSAIMLRSRTNTPFEVVSVRVSLPGFVGIAAPANRDKSRWGVILRSNASPAHGVATGTVVVETNHPDLPTVEVPFIAMVVRTR